MKVLNFLKARKWGILLLILVLAVNFLMAQDSPSVSQSPDAFNILLLIPLVLGILAHWVKSYSRGQTSLSLWQYIVQGLGNTFVTVVGAIGTLIGMVAATPANYTPINFTVCFNVFLLGFSWDSAAGGTAAKMTASVAPPKP